MIRWVTVSGILAALLMCVMVSDVSAQKGKGGKGKGGKGKDFIAEAFKRMDANDDQVVTADEYKKAVKAQMEKFAKKAGKEIPAEKLEAFMKKRLESFEKAVGESRGLNQEQFAEFMKAQFKGKGGKGGKGKKKDV